MANVNLRNMSLEELTTLRDSVQAEIMERAASLGLTISGPRAQPRVAAVKAEQHAQGREAARKLGLSYDEYRKQKTAKRLKVGSAEQLQKFRLWQQAAATKEGLSLSAWRQSEAKRLGCSVNLVEGQLVAAWKSKKGS